MPYILISHDTRYDARSRYIMRYHKHGITSKHQANPKSTKTHHLVAVYSCFSRLCLRPHFGLSSVWPFLSSFFCSSAWHIIGLTVQPANSNIVPSGLGLLPECMYACFCFIFYFISFLLILSLFFFLLDTWYLLHLIIMVARYLVPDMLVLTYSGILCCYCHTLLL